MVFTAVFHLPLALMVDDKILVTCHGNDETATHVQRLERAFELIGEKPKGTACPAIDGILKEADHIAGNVDDRDVLDAANGESRHERRA